MFGDGPVVAQGTPKVLLASVLLDMSLQVVPGRGAVGTEVALERTVVRVVLPVLFHQQRLGVCTILVLIARHRTLSPTLILLIADSW